MSDLPPFRTNPNLLTFCCSPSSSADSTDTCRNSNGTFNDAEGEGHDRDSIALLGQQQALMQATHAAAKKAGSSFVVVLLGSSVAVK